MVARASGRDHGAKRALVPAGSSCGTAPRQMLHSCCKNMADERIDMRQMPHEQWVAFDGPDSVLAFYSGAHSHSTRLGSFAMRIGIDNLGYDFSGRRRRMGNAKVLFAVRYRLACVVLPFLTPKLLPTVSLTPRSGTRKPPLVSNMQREFTCGTPSASPARILGVSSGAREKSRASSSNSPPCRQYTPYLQGRVPFDHL